MSLSNSLKQYLDQRTPKILKCCTQGCSSSRNVSHHIRSNSGFEDISNRCTNYWFWNRAEDKGCTVTLNKKHKKPDEFKRTFLCVCPHKKAPIWDKNTSWGPFVSLLSLFSPAIRRRGRLSMLEVKLKWVGVKEKMTASSTTAGIVFNPKILTSPEHTERWLLLTSRLMQSDCGVVFCFKLSFLFNSTLCSEYQYPGIFPAN